MINTLIFGPPGCGKGTQAQLLKAQYSIIHLSTGELLRKEIEEGSPIGLQSKAIIQAGKLVSDEIVNKLIEKHIVNNKGSSNGFLFDGYPRTLGQVHDLEKILASIGQKIDLVLKLLIREDEIIKRLSYRARTENRLDDKNEDIIKQRITEYQEKTQVLADYFKGINILHEIDGQGKIEDIFDRIVTVINKQQSNG